MLEMLASAVSLPLEVYFSPRNLRLRTENMLASLPPDVSLWTMLVRNPPGGEKARRWWGRIFLALLITPALFTLPVVLLMHPPSIVYLLLISTGGAWAAFVIIMLRVGIPKEPNTIVVIAGIAIVVGCTLGILSGGFNSLSGTTDPQGTAIAFATPAGKMANSLILGTAIGIVIRIVTGSAFHRMRRVMLAGVAIVVPLGLAAALLSAPDAAQHYQRIALAVLLAFTGWFIAPLELLLSLYILVRVQVKPDSAPALWWIAPVAWDDYLMLPLPGTVHLVAALYHTDRELYGRALDRLKQHAFQGRLLEKIEEATEK